MSAPREPIYPTWPTAPGNAATIVLCATQPRAAGGSGAVFTPEAVAIGHCCAIEFVWHRNDQASAANGLRCYAYDDQGAWRETDLKDEFNLPTIGSAAPITVPALSTGQEYRETFIVSHLRGFAFEYTAGATGPTNWNGTIVFHRDSSGVIL